jgi:NADH-quinone oxidoreductase subunit L
MGGLKKYLPVTFATMMIGTLAISGIIPLSGFFSKDEILLQAFVHNKAVWVVAVITAAMTAFYMWRLMSMTFFGGYNGPAWDAAHDKAHDAQAAHADAHHDPHAGGHGHGAWHGPHESPTPMTFPLMALAVGAIVAGLVGVPLAMGGSNAIEKFLEPSFTASESAVASERAAEGAEKAAAESAAAEHDAEPHVSVAVERGLMLFSLFVAICGIALAHKFYVKNPEISEGLAEQWAGPHKVLSNKYYVDEAYDATVISGVGNDSFTTSRNALPL